MLRNVILIHDLIRRHLPSPTSAHPWSFSRLLERGMSSWRRRGSAGGSPPAQSPPRAQSCALPKCCGLWALGRPLTVKVPTSSTPLCLSNLLPPRALTTSGFFLAPLDPEAQPYAW